MKNKFLLIFSIVSILFSFQVFGMREFYQHKKVKSELAKMQFKVFNKTFVLEKQTTEYLVELRRKIAKWGLNKKFKYLFDQVKRVLSKRKRPALSNEKRKKRIKPIPKKKTCKKIVAKSKHPKFKKKKTKKEKPLRLKKTFTNKKERLVYDYFSKRGKLNLYKKLDNQDKSEIFVDIQNGDDVIKTWDWNCF